MGSQMKGNGPEKEVIHSGHFMSTVVHEEPNPSITPLRDGQIRFQIDSSLQRLFECMNEAYKNGVTTPRWKNFNGMKIRLKDRIRLNNAIWRCWHIEYAEPARSSGRRSKPKFIQFITPLDSVPAQEVKPQVTILEEEFWKKRNKAVVSEYITWRKFYWKNAAERLRNQRELRKTPEPNFRPVYQPTDAWVIDDGFFSDIYDTLHSHAMPDDNYSNPHDMSRYGFDTSCFGSFSVVDDLCPPMENQVIFMDNQDYKKPVVNIEYDDRTSSSNNLNSGKNSLPIPSKQLQSVAQSADGQQQQQQSSMVSNSLNQELHYVPNHEPLKQETYLLKPDNHNNTFKQPVNIPVQNHEYQRMKQNSSRQTTVQKQQQQQQSVAPVEIEELRPPPTKRRRSSDFEQYENLHPDTAQNGHHGGGVPIQNQHNYNPSYKSEPYMSHHGQVHPRQSPNVHEQGNGTSGLGSVRGNSGGHSLDGKGMVASMVDKSGMVEMPDGSKVVLMTQLEDGSYVQIKGEGASKVIFTSQQKSAPSPPPLPPRDIRPLPPQQNHTINGNNMPTSISPRPSSSSYHSRSPSISSYSLTDMTTEQSLANMDAYKSERREEVTTYEEIPSQEYDYKVIETGFEQQDPENLSAEQKRRFTMKKGFEKLESLVNGDVGANGPKMSKAAVLSKAKESYEFKIYYTLDHIQKARSEQKRLRQEIDLLRRETENLQQQISQTQDQLPEKGVPMNKPRVDKIQRQYEKFISESTRKNYKFYVFSRIMKRLFESYATVVSTENTTKLQSSARQWVNVQCSMSNIRQISADSLRHLTTETCIVDDRLISQFPMECVQLADREAAGHP